MKTLSLFTASLLMALPGAVGAVTVGFDFINPVSAENESGYWADAYHYESDGVGVRVSGLSSGGDDFSPYASDLIAARLGNFWGGSLGVEENGISHTIDNFESDYDFLMLEFDREVSIDGVGLGWIENDTDISVGAIGDLGEIIPVTNIFDANLGMNAMDSGVNASSRWIVGAFHSFFGDAQDAIWDGFKIDELDVDVNPVPLPATFWFFACALAGLTWVRKRSAR